MTKKKPIELLFTCEHGGNKVPEWLKTFFKGRDRFLHSHRGWDPGALTVGQLLKHQLKAKFIFAEVSRLVVDLNRSPDSPTLHIVALQKALPNVRAKILKDHYQPYRDEVLKASKRAVSQSPLAHFSIHSFTPVLRGKVRQCEIGLLFDPNRRFERKICQALRAELERRLPNVRVRMNYPYRGTGDGQTTSLRSLFPDKTYAGIEIEFNQRWLKRLLSNGKIADMSQHVGEAIKAVIS